MGAPPQQRRKKVSSNMRSVFDFKIIHDPKSFLSRSAAVTDGESGD